MSNERMGILMDTSLCVECYACRVACQNHNVLPAEKKYLTFNFKEIGVFPETEHHLARISCMHCADAPCASVCPVGVLHINEQGFVNYIGNTDEGCIGCSICLHACPYDAPVISDGKMYKCTGCEDLISAGQKPACVDTCIANALQFGPVDKLIEKTNARLAVVRAKFPNANVYGVTQQGGLGMLLLLRTNSTEFGLS